MVSLGLMYPASKRQASKYSALPQPNPLGCLVARCVDRNLSRLLKGSSHETLPRPMGKCLNPCPTKPWKHHLLRGYLISCTVAATSSKPVTITILQARSWQYLSLHHIHQIPKL